MPPFACRRLEYAVPVVPVGRDEVVIVSGAIELV